MAKSDATEEGRRNFKPGDVIIREGDDGNEMFVINAGTVEVSKTILGEERFLNTLSEGDFFGEMSLINQKTRTATVTAKTEVVALALDWETFSRRIKKYQVVALHIIQTLARRLDETLNVVGGLSRTNTSTKVMNELVQLVESEGIVERKFHGEPILEAGEDGDAAAEVSSKILGRSRILIGAGSSTNEKILLKELEEFPHESTVEPDGPSVLRAAQNGKFDIVIVQAQLDSLSGIEVCRLLASYPSTSQLPVVVFSTSDSWRVDARLAGAQAFITVPFNDIPLVSVLEKVLTKTVTIMHVDDNKTIHAIMREMLVDDAFDLVQITDPNEAMKTIESKRPDIILMDVEMPDISGYELCEKVKSDPKTCDIPVVICSKFSSGLDITRGFESGADDYLPKPVLREELLSRIAPLIDRKVRKGRESILVVEDSRVIRNHVVQGLSTQGFSVIAAENGVEALKLLEDNRPDLILTDLEMPEMDGRAFILKVRANPNFKLTPVLMLSARDESSARARGRSAGVDEYITKPFAMDKLIVIVERMLSEYALRKEHEAIRMYLSDAVLAHATERFSRHSADASIMRVEEKYVTVFFCDIVGFTPLCENEKPELVVEKLNRFFDLTVNIVKKNDGLIDKFIGDALMVLFGRVENGAYRAVRCGLEIIEALKEFNRETGFDFHVRIGISSGKVIMGDIGSKHHRRDYTVIGDTVNQAQRLESLAPVDGVLIGNPTFELLYEVVNVKATKEISVKGKEDQVICHEVESLRPFRS